MIFKPNNALETESFPGLCGSFNTNHDHLLSSNVNGINSPTRSFKLLDFVLMHRLSLKNDEHVFVVNESIEPQQEEAVVSNHKSRKLVKKQIYCQRRLRKSTSTSELAFVHQSLVLGRKNISRGGGGVRNKRSWSVPACALH